MVESEIYRILTALRCRKIRTRGNRVWSTCPFEHEHEGGVDNKPYSFKVEINTDGKSQYHCFACKNSDSLEWLAFQRGLWNFDGKKKYYKKSDIPQTNRGVFDIDDAIVLPEKSIDEYCGKYPSYIRNRGVLPFTAKQWKIGHDERYCRAVFPYWDVKGRLRGAIGRSWDGSEPKYLAYSYDQENEKLVPYVDKRRQEDFISLSKSEVLYGEHRLKEKKEWLDSGKYKQSVVLVEGHMDVVLLYQMNMIALGLQGSFFSDLQQKTLKKCLSRKDRVYLMFDGDKAGKEVTKKVYEKIKGFFCVYIVNTPNGKDPADLCFDEVKKLLVDSRKNKY